METKYTPRHSRRAANFRVTCCGDQIPSRPPPSGTGQPSTHGLKVRTPTSDRIRDLPSTPGPYPVFGGQVSDLVRVHPVLSGPVVDESVDANGDFTQLCNHAIRDVCGPELAPQSVIRDTFRVRLPSLARRAKRRAEDRRNQGKTKVTAAWRKMLESGEARNRSDLARRLGVSRARVTQVLGPARG